MARKKLPTVLFSAVMYLMVVGTSLTEESKRSFAKAFGYSTFGWPIAAVVVLAETILFLPMPFVFWALGAILAQARRDECDVGGAFSLMHYLIVGAAEHPQLARSRWISIAGMSYYFLITTAWIVYAAIRRA